MAAPLIAYPAAESVGKWHASRDGFTPVALCRGTLLLDLNAIQQIHVQPGQERVHPIVCRACLNIWRAQ